MDAAPGGQADDPSEPINPAATGTTDASPETIVTDEALGALGFDVGSPALEMITDADGRVRLLRMFCEEHATSAEQARASVLNGDHTVARDLLHKLMGTSATVGLDELHRAVLALQDEIHTRPDSVDPSTLDAFTDELDRVVAALQPLCDD